MKHKPYPPQPATPTNTVPFPPMAQQPPLAPLQGMNVVGVAASVQMLSERLEPSEGCVRLSPSSIRALTDAVVQLNTGKTDFPALIASCLIQDFRYEGLRLSELKRLDDAGQLPEIHPGLHPEEAGDIEARGFVDSGAIEMPWVDLIGIGWVDPCRPPTIQDLFPPEILLRCLDLWHHCGVNIAHEVLAGFLVGIDTDQATASDTVCQMMAWDMSVKLDNVRRLWDGRAQAAGAATLAKGGIE